MVFGAGSDQLGPELTKLILNLGEGVAGLVEDVGGEHLHPFLGALKGIQVDLLGGYRVNVF